MIRVLIIDNSRVVRRSLERVLDAVEGIEVVGSAEDAFEGRDLIVELDPDVVILDLQLPKMDGITFLRRLMSYYPIRVVVFSSFARGGSQLAMQAHDAGAIEVLGKPKSSSDWLPVMKTLTEAVRAAARARLRLGDRPRAIRARPRATASTAEEAPLQASFPAQAFLAIGASTGGPEAVQEVMSRLPANAPATVIVQHMPAAFTTVFARRLDDRVAMRVREAVQGDRLEPGLALLAPGGKHMLVRERRGVLVVDLTDGPPVHHQKPAVDPTFQSFAEVVGAKGLGVVLTGMGADGAAGLLKMREAGAHTIAQDEETSVVYGMPREAAAQGAAVEILPLEQIGPRIVEVASGGDVLSPAGGEPTHVAGSISRIEGSEAVVTQSLRANLDESHPDAP